jgi:hypothetical protein
MFGQGVLPVPVDGALCVVPGVVGVVLGVVAVVAGVVVVLVLDGAAAAAAMPTAEPPTASAPATIVAFRRLDICMLVRPSCRGCCSGPSCE